MPKNSTIKKTKDAICVLRAFRIFVFWYGKAGFLLDAHKGSMNFLEDLQIFSRNKIKAVSKIYYCTDYGR